MKRRCVDLTGSWRFCVDPYDDGEAGRYFDPKVSDRAWRSVRVPCTLDACLPCHDWYEGAGWFRRTFAAPASWRGKRVAVRFEGVNYHAKVWVNGRCVGEHRDGFLRFEFRIDPFLRPGGPNVIAVRADNERLADEVPGMLRGWRPYGGILREVSLIVTEPLHVGDVRIQADADGRLRAESDLVNDGKKAAEGELVVEVVDSRGKVIAREKASTARIGGGRKRAATVETCVRGAKAWSPQSPTLYSARLRLRTRGKVVDETSVRFGFRTIEVVPDGLLLNGKRIFLTGFNRHEDSPRTGPCTDLAQVRWDLTEMKKAGCNFVRLCHYPHHPGELDLCDELGVLAMCEIPLYWWKVSWHEQDKIKHGVDNAAKLAAARRQVESMIRRDRNHPSVLFWSVSNECQEAEPVVYEANAELVRLARSLDATRPAVHVACFWRESPHFEEDDVLCVNMYPNWIPRRNARVRTAASALAAGARIWRRELAKLRRRYPNKPILIAEFGYPALDEAVAGGAMSLDTQARSIEAEYAGMGARYVCGTTVWCWADHPWPEEPFIRYLTTSPYGVLTRDRRKRPAHAVLSRLFQARQRGTP